MKSRIKATQPLIIIGYMISEKNIEGLTKTAEKMNANLKLCFFESACEQIGFLAGFSGFKKSNDICANAPNDECLIFSGFNSKDMDRLLSELKSQGIYIPLKCVVTQFNQSWKIHDLIEELKKEHEKMNG
jgi:hypothetical protein